MIFKYIFIIMMCYIIIFQITSLFVDRVLRSTAFLSFLNEVISESLCQEKLRESWQNTNIRFPKQLKKVLLLFLLRCKALFFPQGGTQQLSEKLAEQIGKERVRLGSAVMTICQVMTLSEQRLHTQITSISQAAVRVITSFL